ncbi:branched-chain amino acid ABC transporter permease [Halobacteriales archaeon QS_5_70_17]|nr:MAG: branched-chain amino acid ABC transporter permease [Halobacteriales archaeon QS_5_70_17]
MGLNLLAVAAVGGAGAPAAILQSGVSNIVVNGLIISALYAVVAIGFTLIFGVGGVLNLAHGASITVGAFGAYYVARVFGMGAWAGLVAGVLVAAAFGAALYLAMIRRMEDEPIMVMILTLVTAVAVEQFVLTVEGSQPKAIPALVGGVTRVAGTNLQHNLVVVFAVSWAIILALFLFVNYTDAGKALIATSMSRKGAALVGIESDRVNLATWVIAGALAGLAGVFLGSFQTAHWAMGRAPLVLSFTIVVLGGVGSIKGSVVGAYLIGFLEVITTRVFDPRLQTLVPLVVLLLVLLVKPEGLFGRELAEA